MTGSAIKQIEEQLEKVAIHLTWYDVAGKLKHGTAFFVTADGIALTAYHNIDVLVDNPAGPLMGRWQGQDLRFNWKLPEAEHAAWQREHDIAVLQSEAPVGIATLDSGYLDPKLDAATRTRHWASSQIVMAGFGRGQQFNLKPGGGRLASEPLGFFDRDKDTYEALQFHSSLAPNGVDDAPGLSGSPVYCPADGSIVGVTIAVRTELYAAELWPVSANWAGSHGFVKKLKVRRNTPPPPARWALLAACLFLTVAVAGGWMWWRQTHHTMPRELSADVLRVETRMAEPLTDVSTFKAGERVRFRLTSPKDGHLYVVNQEIVAGHTGDPMIIFPTLLTGAGRNRVKAGERVDFPSEDDIPPYVAAGSDVPGYDGELLTLLVFPNPLPLMLERRPIPLDPALFSIDGIKPRLFTQPFAPPGDALAIRRIHLRVRK